jgi:hypothetical protein
MVLLVHTDSSYLSKPGGKSIEAGHVYLSNCNYKDFNNCTILTLSTIIKHIMLSASKAKLAALYYGCKLAAPLQTTLEELGHFQPTPTLVTTNNITAQDLTMETMTSKASKSMDQCFHWLLNVRMHNTNSKIFDARVFSIVPTTPANIMPQNTINMFSHFLFLTTLQSPNSDCTCLPGNHDSTFVIQCQHHGPLFLTTTQVDCPLARVC